MSRHANCGPDCRYKSLYEGSQESLADMAARQANGVKRVDGLRLGLLSALKRHYPRQYTENEKRLGKPLSSLSDEALLAYLGAFLAAPPPVSAVRAATAPTEAAQPGTTTQETQLGNEVDEAAAMAGVTAPVDRGARVAWLAEALRTAAHAEPGVDEDEWAFLSEYDPQSSDEPIDWTSLFEDEVGQVGHELHPTQDSPDPDDSPEPDPTSYGEGSQPRDELAVSTTTKTDEADGELDDLFDDGDSHDWDLIAAGVSEADKADTYSAQGGTANPAPDTGHHDLVEEGADSPVSPPNPPTQEAVEHTGREVSPEPSAPVAATRQQLHLPGSIRPEIVATPPRPAARKKTVKKEVRVSAEAPASPTTNEAIERVLAGPVPVFASDLTAALNSTEAYTQWEDHARSLGKDSPVRFVTPKPRHRARGLLILPITGGPAEGVWAQCLADPQLRGTRMYELAVVLHRLGTSVRAVSIDPHVVVVRAATDRGMTAVVLVSDSTSVAEVCDKVEGLLKERLSSIVVLSMSTAADAVDKLADGIRVEAATREWKVTTPVVATRSWSWAENPAGTVLAVIG